MSWRGVSIFVVEGTWESECSGEGASAATEVEVITYVSQGQIYL
jgi:hypothetical protein